MDSRIPIVTSAGRAPPRRRAAVWIVSTLLATLLPLGASQAQTPLAPLLNADAPRRIPGQYIVVFKPGVAATAKKSSQDRARALGGKISYTYVAALQGFSASLSDNAVKALRQSPEVAYIEVDQVGQLNTIQVNPPAGLDRVSERLLPLDSRYTYSETGNNVHVYVIDTGIRPTHNEFGGRVSGGVNTMNAAAGTNDCHGHGTHVAGTVGGATFGIAKQALLHPVRAGDCFNTYLAPIIAAVDWVTANRTLPAVANLSSAFGVSTALDTAIANSVASGVTYSIAAGNDFGGDACNRSPARAPDAITVGATDPNNDTRANFSNIGTCLDLFAPGVDTLSAGIGSDSATATLSGTSMAAPHVAGVAARYLQNHPGATPAMVWTAIHAADNTNATAGWGGVVNRGAGSPNELLHYGSLNDGMNDGDPHIVTVNGVRYDFQPGGEFVALLGGPGMEIQTRQTPVPNAPWVSVNTAVAARVGSRRVSWQPDLSGEPDPNGLQLRIDGALVSPGPGGIGLGIGGRVARYGSNGIQIDFPDGSLLLATSNWWEAQKQWYINVRVYRTPATEGIMGALHDKEWTRPGFADSWRVTDKTTLFDYRDGDSTGNYASEPFPDDKIPPMKPENVELARRLCAPVDDQDLQRGCLFDVGTTGDEIFAKSARAGALLQRGGTRTALGADGRKGEEKVAVTAYVTRLSSGEGMPVGSVSLSIDGKPVGTAQALDKNGRARWDVSAADLSGRSAVAQYAPTKGSGYLSSTSGALEYAAEAKRSGDPLADPAYRQLSK